MLVVGIITGLGTALAASLSYLFSRRFLQRTSGSVLQLLVASHLIMGVVSLMLLPFFWSMYARLEWNFWWPLAVNVGAYLVGQAALFQMLRYTESSRAAPLLGLKILVLAILVATFQGQHLDWIQWLAVFLSAGAAVLLNDAGTRLPWQAWLALGGALVGYAISDISIVMMVRRMEPALGHGAPLLGVCLSYLLCGLVSLPIALVGARPALTHWQYAWPHAVAWFVSMVLLYVCFAACGVVLGSIFQSTRGLVSILLAPLVASWGWTHLENHVVRRVFWKRMAGGILMLSAIALYSTRH